jgi:hypothetical protein
MCIADVSPGIPAPYVAQFNTPPLLLRLLPEHIDVTFKEEYA